MRDKERCFDVTSIRVLPFPVENFPIKVNVVVIDGIVEGDSDHLRDILAIRTGRPNFAQISRYLSAVL